ncbi:MAG: GatB/YqeY domain-containing protein [Candidatus Taylorbacteria bacterium]|nr:GatB/YqeY domain-containing protein [Candidatus Taylorbacteria bacterium]
MLKDKLQTDVKEALKSGNAVKRMVLNLVLSAVKSRELEKRTKLSKTESDATKLEEVSKLNDEEVVEVLSSEMKKRKDSVEQYTKGGRPELAEKETREIAILIGYMPEQMSEEAVREEVKKAISQTSASGPKDMGKVIGAVMVKIKGKADGQMVSRLVKEELQNRLKNA